MLEHDTRAKEDMTVEPQCPQEKTITTITSSTTFDFFLFFSSHNSLSPLDYGGVKNLRFIDAKDKNFHHLIAFYGLFV